MESAIKVKLEGKSLVKSQDKTLVSGILTGQAAGLIMAVVVMIVFTLFLGKNPVYPVQVIGSMAFGEPALQGYNIGAIIAGLLLHQLGPSLLWGFIFAILAKKMNVETVSQSLKLGLGIGIVSMVGPYILIPTLMNVLHGVDIWNREVPIFWDWAAHIVFGAAFALYPKIKATLNS